MFKTWKESMEIRYIIDIICIVAMGVILQYQMNELQDLGKEW